MNAFLLNVPPNQNPGAATVHYSLCMKKRRCLLYIFWFVTMHYSISTDFSITLFGFLSSLAFNNRIEKLTLITKFRGPPIFGGGGPDAVLLLPEDRAGPLLTIGNLRLRNWMRSLDCVFSTANIHCRKFTIK